jgi:hypothetical protein
MDDDSTVESPDERDFRLKRWALLTRGVIINHYACVEFALDELLYRCRLCPEYRSKFKRRLPFKVEEKIALAATLVGLDGRLRSWRGDLEPALAALNEYTGLRNACAHGFLEIRSESDTGVTVLRLHKFTEDASSLRMDHWELTSEGVEFVTARLSIYAQTLLELLVAVVAGLPSLDMAYPPPFRGHEG